MSGSSEMSRGGYYYVMCAECYQLEHSLYKHYTSLGSSVTSQRARSLMACSALCHQLARCQTFSYGDAVYSGANCLLSERGGAELSVSADLVSDPGWAVYSLTQQGAQRCQQSGGGDDSGHYHYVVLCISPSQANKCIE